MLHRFIHRLMKKREEPPDPAHELYQLSYGIAYYFLPDLLFSDPQRTINYFYDPEVPPGPFLYVMACQEKRIEPSRAAVETFLNHMGRLSDGREYYIIQYPTPPAPRSKKLKDMTVFPFFSAIVRSETTGEIQYFILGQGPYGQTTLRTAYYDGSNANLGPGPEPELNAFLKALTEVDPASRTVAVHKFRSRGEDPDTPH